MKLYNTLTKQIEAFEPYDSDNVKFFVCGPTVYDYSHLGHAKTYIQMDTLAGALRYFGYKVFYLQNITDVDDKIIERAKQAGCTWQELRDKFEAAYKEDMQTLGNSSVTEYARATDHIPDIIRQVQTLLNAGHAYTIDNDGIYFEIATFPDYGKLSGRREIQEHDAQSRIDQSDQKRGWNDFCLWKFSKPDEPVWDAPFGNGRPGWHIEDTAITEHFFGPQYDVHGGAIDLIFPHHEAEITQMESASGKVPFVKYWMHTGFLNIKGAKMAKSTGNFLTIRSVLEKGYDPQAIRLLMLQSHYRSPADFSFENLDAAENRLRHWKEVSDQRWQVLQPPEFLDDLPADIAAFQELEEKHPHTTKSQELLNEVAQALQNDLDTPTTLSAIDGMMNLVEQEDMTSFILPHFIKLLQLISQVLGIDLFGDDVTEDQKQLIAERENAREAKDWAKSDELRDELKEQRISLRDTPHGAIWFRR